MPKAAAAGNQKMAFIQWQPHTVPAAWSKGIEEVLKTQQTIDYELLDGRAARHRPQDLRLFAATWRRRHKLSRMAVPIALGMGIVGLAAFLWSMRSGQYEDL